MDLLSTTLNGSHPVEVLPPAVPKAELKPDASPPRWTFGRLLRTAVGLLLLAVVLWMCYPGHWRVVSNHAVVNAPVVAVRAPISGTVRMASLSMGRTVQADEELLTINNALPEQGRLEEWKTEAATLTEHMAGIR
jgi:multidrug resistance efflux pump